MGINRPGQRRAFGLALTCFGLLVITTMPVSGSPGLAEAVLLEQREAVGASLELAADEAGALGTYWDEDTDEFVVVVPATRPHAFSRSDAIDVGYSVRVEQRAIDQATIDAISLELLGIRPALKDYAYGFGFDPVTGHVILESEAPESAFAAILGRFAGKIEFRAGRFFLAGWSNDSSPFKGGAFLQGAGGGICTLGFTVVQVGTNGQVRDLITAGHCFAHNEQTNAGVAKYGARYPTYDVQMIWGDGIAGIWDSPLTTKPVSTAADPTIGTTYCTTGRSSGFVCNWTVRQKNKTICYTQNYPGCASGLAGFNRPTGGPIIGGDSGGPLWFKHANGGAGIRGVISGFYWDLGTQDWMSYATQYNKIITEVYPNYRALIQGAAPP